MSNKKSPNRLSALDRHLTQKRAASQRAASSEQPAQSNGAQGNIPVKKTVRAKPHHPSPVKSQLFDHGEPIKVESAGHGSQAMEAHAFDFDEPIAVQHQSEETKDWAEASSWDSDEDNDWTEASSWERNGDNNWAEASSWDDDDTEDDYAEDIIEAPVSYEAASFDADEESPDVEALATDNEAITVTSEVIDEIDKDAHNASLAADVEAMRHDFQAIDNQSVVTTDQQVQPTTAFSAQIQDLRDEVQAMRQEKQQNPSSPDEAEAMAAQMQALKRELQSMRVQRSSEALSSDYWNTLEQEPMFQAFDQQMDEPSDMTSSQSASALSSEAHPVEATVVPASDMTMEPQRTAKLSTPEAANSTMMELFESFEQQMDQQEALNFESAHTIQQQSSPEAQAQIIPPSVRDKATELPADSKSEAQSLEPLSQSLGKIPKEFEEKFKELLNTINQQQSTAYAKGNVAHQDHIPYLNLSKLRRQLDKEHGSVANLKSSSKINLLPKSEWWRLFIDRAHQENGPLAYDQERSPGYYYTMMTLFENKFSNLTVGKWRDSKTYFSNQRSPRDSVLNPEHNKKKEWLSGNKYRLPDSNKQIMDSKNYLEISNFIRKHVLDGANGSYKNVLNGWSEKGISFMMNKDLYTTTNLQALKELITEGVIKIDINPRLKKEERKEIEDHIKDLSKGSANAFVSVALRKIIKGGKSKKDNESKQEEFIWRADAGMWYSKNEAPKIVNNLFARYYRQMWVLREKSTNDKLGAIVTLIRNLHVGHFFPDANGRINIMFLLNYLLIENGFEPTIVKQPSLFGGGSKDELIKAVHKGQATFKSFISHGLKFKSLDEQVVDDYDYDSQQDDSTSHDEQKIDNSDSDDQ